MPHSNISDVLVIGGGAIGLSVAYQLALDGLGVTLLERGEPGREASWAGAGILPPASWYVDDPALDALCLAAGPKHAEWSDRLRESTGLDDEYWPCGAEYQATEENADYVETTLARWRSLGVVAEGGRVPAEAQVRNPRRLRALVAACRAVGVRIEAGAEVTRLEGGRDRSRLAAVQTARQRYAADAFCLAAGCWTPALARRATSHAPGRPVRGQMLVLSPGGFRLDRIIHRYPFYAVPRRDGRVLIGATVEDAGFENQTTAEARATLLDAARAIDGRLAGAEIEAHWSGLRPASDDTLPQIGPLPGWENAWVASGHHRSGLQLAPPTAEIISSMIRGVASGLPTEAFDPARFAVRSAVG